MERNYLLLSNNKSSGPYSLEQLLQLSLSPTDLIWIKNESATWQNVSEIHELNGMVKTSCSANDPLVATTAINETAVIDKNDSKKSPLKKVYVSLPSETYHQTVADAPSLEDKAEALKQKIFNLATLNKQDIKTKNSTSVPDRKTLPLKKRIPFGILLYGSLIVLVVMSSFFLFRRQPQRLTNTQPPALLRNTSGTIPKLKTQTLSLKDTVVIKPSMPSVHQPVQHEEAKQKLIAEDNVDTVAADKIKVAKSPLARLETTRLPMQLELRKTTGLLEKTPVTALFETASQYFKTDGGIGLAITIQNKSAQSIRTAIIDVFYFDTTEKQIGKETLYFGKMLPGTSLTKKSTPKESAYASYRVDLVSSEKNGLYVYK